MKTSSYTASLTSQKRSAQDDALYGCESYYPTDPKVSNTTRPELYKNLGYMNLTNVVFDHKYLTVFENIFICILGVFQDTLGIHFKRILGCILENTKNILRIQIHDIAEKVAATKISYGRDHECLERKKTAISKKNHFFLKYENYLVDCLSFAFTKLIHDFNFCY
ncbi:hypothetical protein BpHYR1_037455 [Brachionus plicatilis]|uniref:Uncharacterized protein n=1 Tax=Brachionus plicatilis TaxID=10195 RepID=A0A3M7SFZ9_BRAPC|nr:hypothetical protein BpHYR1_037455 [Brachionus plicatilis]